MPDYHMLELLEHDEAYDVSKCKVIEPDVYLLIGLSAEDIKNGDIDYCDAERERWVWSIGKHLESGEIHASLDARFYGHPEYECLWLR